MLDPLGLELLFEELDKINYADHSSELRRSIYQLKDGPYFIKMLSEIDILERSKKKKEEQFWMNKARAKEYTQKLQFLAKVDELVKRIEQYENDLSLACIGLGKYNPGVIDLLKKWENELFQFKIELLAHENPNLNQCQFSIYGSGVDKIVQMYVSIFQAKNYEIDAETIWFKDSKSGKKKAEKELIKKWDHKDLLISPSKYGDSLYGVLFNLKGPCVLLFLQDEMGIHHGKMSQTEDR